MITEKDINVFKEIFNMIFSKTISNFSLLIDERIDMTVPSIMHIKNLNSKYLFEEANLIFNDVTGFVNSHIQDITGFTFFLMEFNKNSNMNLKKSDLENINSVFKKNFHNIFKEILNKDILIVNSKEISEIENISKFFSDNIDKNNYNKMFLSKWEARNKIISGYFIVVLNLEDIVRLSKFNDLKKLS